MNKINTILRNTKHVSVTWPLYFYGNREFITFLEETPDICIEFQNWWIFHTIAPDQNNVDDFFMRRPHRKEAYTKWMVYRRMSD